MHSFSTPGKHQKTVRWVCFQGIAKGCIGNECVTDYSQVSKPGRINKVKKRCIVYIQYLLSRGIPKHEICKG